MADKKLGEPRMDYQDQVQHNNFAFSEMVKTVRPEIWMLMDLLDQTGVNYLVLVKAMRHINNIATGTKFGEVRIQIQNGNVTFIYGEEAEKVNEPAILVKEKVD